MKASAASLLPTGCALNGLGGFNPFAPKPACTLPAKMDLPALVEHLNRNVEQVSSWRSTDVEIRAHGKRGPSVKLSAVIAVRRPRHFRLIANSLAGNEADFGSNSRRFWFWMRRGKPKHVFTARHDSLQQAGRYLKIPFHPDWLMETLGVVPFETSNLKLESVDEKRYRLVSENVTPAGQSVRKVTLVGTCYGYVRQQSLYDANSRLIARAKLSDHRRDESTGTVLPHRIALNWPQAEMALSLSIGAIEVNPAHIPAETWQLPRIPGYPPVALGRR